MYKVTFKIPDMACQNCVDAITAELEKVQSSVLIFLNTDTKEAEVTMRAQSQAAANEAVFKAVQAAGFTPEKIAEQ